MNPVLHEGVRNIQLGWIAGVMTIVFVAIFIGWACWACAAGNRERFEAARQLPLTNGDEIE